MRPNPLIPSVRCTPMAYGPPLRCSTRPILRHDPAPPGARAGGRQGIIEVTVRTTPVPFDSDALRAVSYTHLRAHETDSYLVCRLLLEKKKTIYVCNRNTYFL